MRKLNLYSYLHVPLPDVGILDLGQQQIGGKSATSCGTCVAPSSEEKVPHPVAPL